MKDTVGKERLEELRRIRVLAISNTKQLKIDGHQQREFRGPEEARRILNKKEAIKKLRLFYRAPIFQSKPDRSRFNNF
jgi:hypothetical protein